VPGRGLRAVLDGHGHGSSCLKKTGGMGVPATVPSPASKHRPPRPSWGYRLAPLVPASPRGGRDEGRIAKQVRSESNAQPAVLETDALPIELRTCRRRHKATPATDRQTGPAR